MDEGNFDIRPDISRLKAESDMRLDQEIQYDLDSDLDLGWHFYDSPLEDYEKNFKETLPGGIQSMDEYVKKNYDHRKGDLVGIELGGPGNNLFANLAPGYFRKTAGFTLHKTLNKAVDDMTPPNKHEIIEADVFNKRTEKDKLAGYQEIENWTKVNGKADIIIERMVAPIDSPYSDHLLLIIKRWYKLLNKHGTMFLYLPRNYDYTEDIEKILNSNKDVFDYQVQELDFRNLAKRELDGTFIRLRKLEGAPDSMDEIINK